MTEVKPVILVIDDTPAQLELISGILKDSYKVKVATSGEMGLRVANKGNAPDLILLDLLMPGMTGRETLMEIRSDPGLFEVPVIILSAADAAALGDDMQEDYFAALTKPVDPVALTRTISEALNASALQ